jgi:hypothetical protein
MRILLCLLILSSNSIFSQVIRKVDGERVVVFTLQQAKAVNDTFVSQKKEIERLKNIKPIVRIDTVQTVQIVEVQKDQLFTIEGIVFIAVQALIMLPLIFTK